MTTIDLKMRRELLGISIEEMSQEMSQDLNISGSLLKMRRELLGISIEEMSNNLNIPIKDIELYEKGIVFND